VLAATNYPFLDIFWTMLIFFLWIVWFFLLFRIIIDVFRRRDIGGGKKALWIVFLIVVPFLGVLVYLIVNSQSMTDRDVEQAQHQQRQFDSYVKSVAQPGGGAAAEIASAKQLLDSGAITQEEFDKLKANALAQ
jgi:predicted PurR-regulated permease PerM